MYRSTSDHCKSVIKTKREGADKAKRKTGEVGSEPSRDEKRGKGNGINQNGRSGVWRGGPTEFAVSYWPPETRESRGRKSEKFRPSGKRERK